MGVDVVAAVGTGGVVGAREACCCWVGGVGHPVCNMSVSADFPQPSLSSFELVVVEEEDLSDLEEDVDLADLEVVASTLLLLLLLELSSFLSLPPPPLCQTPPGNCRNNFRPPPPILLLLLSLFIFI